MSEGVINPEGLTMDLVQILCEATMTAAALRLERFPKVHAREDRAKLVADALKNVLGEEMPGFIRNVLKEAMESALGEACLKEIINVQVNKWAIDALKIVKEKLDEYG
jgi:hypothetical protein